jgi:hypothetical protein
LCACLSDSEAVINRKSILTIVWTEDAAKPKDCQLTKGFMNLSQVERCHVCLSPDAEPFPHRDNKHFKPGTTSGSVLSNVPPPSLDDAWQLTIRQKKQLYGDARTTSEPDPQSNGKHPTKRDDESEPVNWWAMPANLYDEILYRFNTKAVIDLCPSSDSLPILCIENGLMYLGLCFTDAHMDHLKRRLASAVFAKYTTEGSPLYQPSLSKIVHGLHGGQTVGPGDQAGGGPGQAGGAGDRAKGRVQRGGRGRGAAAAAAAAAAGGNGPPPIPDPAPKNGDGDGGDGLGGDPGLSDGDGGGI